MYNIDIPSKATMGQTIWYYSPRENTQVRGGTGSLGLPRAALLFFPTVLSSLMLKFTVAEES